MLIVTCKRCGFAIGCCVCGKKMPETQFPKSDDPRLLARLEELGR